MLHFRRMFTAVLSAALAGCATQLPGPAAADSPVPAQWFAPLPHGGQVTELNVWWQSNGDPALAQLIDAAQRSSPTVALAKFRIAQARAQFIGSKAALWPSIDASGSVNRSGDQSQSGASTVSAAAIRATLPLDLFGGAAAESAAASHRLAGMEAGWHLARVALAAEVATQYFILRASLQLLSLAREDAASRADTARITKIKASAGLAANATLALARASDADGHSLALAARAKCDLVVKALVELTGMDEIELRRALENHPPRDAPAIPVPEIPARLLSQRPDVFIAERSVEAARADVGAAIARRYPQLSLSGSIGAVRVGIGKADSSQSSWSIGPISLSVPLFDGGARAAMVDASASGVEAAIASYRASVRQAVREVEQALTNLAAATERLQHAERAQDGYRRVFEATESSYRNGLSSLLELEDTRRSRLSAENTVLSLRLQRNTAWVELYRSTGGGWSAQSHTALASPPIAGTPL